MRWLLVFLLAFLLSSTACSGWLQKIGLGRLPGDFTLKLFGRELYVPLASSLVLSFIAMGIGALL
jgi:hypothetical protein